MAYSKELGVGTSALVPIPSDIVNIPTPGSLVFESTTTGLSPAITASGVTELIDASGDFISENRAKIGMVVYSYGPNISSVGAGYVLQVVSDTKLLVQTVAGGGNYILDFASALGSYQLYANSTEPCMLYPVAQSKFSTYSFESAGGDIIDIGLPATPVLNTPVIPVQVQKYRLTNTEIAATTPLTLLAVW